MATIQRRLNDPATAEKIGRLLDRLDEIENLFERLDAVLTLADQAPGFIAMAVDTIDEVVQQAEAAGIDVDKRIRSTYGLGEKLTSPATVDALGEVLDPGAVTVVGMLGTTLAKCREECLAQPEPPAKGLRDLWKLSRSNDGRRAIAFLVSFGRLWGQGIKQLHAEYHAKRKAESEE